MKALILIIMILAGCSSSQLPNSYEEGVVLVKLKGDPVVYALSTNGMTVPEAIAFYQKDSRVEYAEPNYIKRAL